MDEFGEGLPGSGKPYNPQPEQDPLGLGMRREQGPVPGTGGPREPGRPEGEEGEVPEGAQAEAGVALAPETAEIRTTIDPRRIRETVMWVLFVEHWFKKGPGEDWKLDYLVTPLLFRLRQLRDRGPLYVPEIVEAREEQPRLAQYNARGRPMTPEEEEVYRRRTNREVRVQIPERTRQALMKEIRARLEDIKATQFLKSAIEMFSSIAGSRTNIPQLFTVDRFVKWGTKEIRRLFNLPEMREGEQRMGEQIHKDVMLRMLAGMRDGRVKNWTVEDYERRTLEAIRRIKGVPKGQPLSEEEKRDARLLAEHQKGRERGLTVKDYREIKDKNGKRILEDEDIKKIMDKVKELKKKGVAKYSNAGRNILTFRQYGELGLSEEQINAIEAKIEDLDIFRDLAHQVLETNPWCLVSLDDRLKDWIREKTDLWGNRIALKDRLGNIYAYLPEERRLWKFEREIQAVVGRMPIEELQEALDNNEELPPENQIVDYIASGLMQKWGMSALYAIREDGTVSDDPTLGSELSHLIWMRWFTLAKTLAGDFYGAEEAISVRPNFLVAPFLVNSRVYARYDKDKGDWIFEKIKKDNAFIIETITRFNENNLPDLRNLYELTAFEGVPLSEEHWLSLDRLEVRNWMLSVFFGARPSEGLPQSVFEILTAAATDINAWTDRKEAGTINKALRLSVGIHMVTGESIQEWLEKNADWVRQFKDDGKALLKAFDNLEEAARQVVKLAMIKNALAIWRRQLIEDEKKTAKQAETLFGQLIKQVPNFLVTSEDVQKIWREILLEEKIRIAKGQSRERQNLLKRDELSKAIELAKKSMREV